MATLLRGPGPDDRSGSAVALAGCLDPLTLATYQWRVATNAYDTPEVLDALAGRLSAVVMYQSHDGVERRGSVG